MPSVVGFGAVAGGDADVAPAYPGGIAAGDFALLLCECNGAETVPAVTGFTEATGSPLSQTNTTLTVRRRVLDGSETAPTVPDPGNHVAAVLGVFRDVDPDDPIHAIATDRKLGSTAAGVAPGLVTLLPDCLVVVCIAYNSDDAGPVASAELNASLSALTERVDAGTISGGGGGLIVYTGGKALAGLVDETDYTLNVAQTPIAMVLALKPKRKVTIGGTVQIAGVAAPNGVGVVRIFDLTVGDTEVVADVAGGAGAFTALVRYATHDYVAVYDDGTNRGASGALVAGAATHDITIETGSGGGGPPVAPTATTATLVRDAIAAAILALTPTSLPASTFKKYDKELEYEAAMQQGVAHCFRVFQCRFAPPEETPLVSNSINERWRYPFTVEVAYPRTHYKTADVPVLELDQVQDEDKRLISELLEDVSLATWIKSGASFERETVDKVTFLRFGATFELVITTP